MKPIEISDQNFDSEVLQSDLPTLVDFWAEWCGPCKLIAPVIEELAQEYDGKIKFAKLNVDENPQKAGMFGVMSIPNLKLFKNGKIVDEVVGAAPKEIFQRVLEKHI